MNKEAQIIHNKSQIRCASRRQLRGVNMFMGVKYADAPRFRRSYPDHDLMDLTCTDTVFRLPPMFAEEGMNAQIQMDS